MTLREKIAAADDRPLAPVEVPEWGVTVYLRPMSLRERLDLQSLIGDSGTIKFAPLLARTLLESSGDRIWSDDQVGEVEDRSPEVIGRLGELAMTFHRLRPEDTDAAAKNSDPSPSA